MVRLVYRGLLSKRGKNTLRLWLLFIEHDKPPQPITVFDGGSILVLAPHMDDEVIGCGGAIRKHVISGGHTTVVYLTDGCRGNPQLYTHGLQRGALAKAESQVVSQRKEEARRSAQILGVHETVFLDRPDGRLEADSDLISTLWQVLRDLRPSVIYLPSVLDPHEDHWATNLALYELMRDARLREGWSPICRQYEVWAALVPNRLLDVTDVFEIKRRALQQFQSQLIHTDYERSIEGLNSYRSMLQFHGRGYAEAFFESTVEQHRALVERAMEKR